MIIVETNILNSNFKLNNIKKMRIFKKIYTFIIAFNIILIKFNFYYQIRNQILRIINIISL